MTKVAHRLSKLGFKLRAAIGLNELHKAVEASGQAGLQKRAALLCRQRGQQQHVGLLAEYVYGSKGKDLPEVDTVHLHDLAGGVRLGNRAAWLLPASLLLENVPF